MIKRLTIFITSQVLLHEKFRNWKNILRPLWCKSKSSKVKEKHDLFSTKKCRLSLLLNILIFFNTDSSNIGCENFRLKISYENKEKSKEKCEVLYVSFKCLSVIKSLYIRWSSAHINILTNKVLVSIKGVAGENLGGGGNPRPGMGFAGS